MNNPTLPDLDTLLDKLVSQLRPRIESAGQAPLMLGIHTGGWWVAQVLHQRLNLRDPLGGLNSQFHRDDFNQNGLHANVGASDLPLSVQDRDVILVDDILQTGRTTRAAMNEIFDYGRPKRISLVVLLERDQQRELPIQADISGGHIELAPEQNIKLTGPTPLQLTITAKQ